MKIQSTNSEEFQKELINNLLAGIEFAKDNNPNAAEDCYNNIVKACDDKISDGSADCNIYSLKATALSRLRNDDEATDFYQQALEMARSEKNKLDLDPVEEVIRLREDERPEDSFYLCKLLLSFEPDNEKYLGESAETLYHLKRYSEALEQIYEALRLEPGSSGDSLEIRGENRFRKEKILHALGRPEPSERINDPDNFREKIQKIQVFGLFHKYDHTLELFEDSRINIIYGLNGTGKSTTMRIIKDFFSGDYGKFFSNIFHKFTICCNSGKSLTVYKYYSELVKDALFEDNTKKWLYSEKIYTEKGYFIKISEFAGDDHVFKFYDNSFEELVFGDDLNDDRINEMFKVISEDIKYGKYVGKMLSIQKPSLGGHLYSEHAEQVKDEYDKEFAELGNIVKKLENNIEKDTRELEDVRKKKSTLFRNVALNCNLCDNDKKIINFVLDLSDVFSNGWPWEYSDDENSVLTEFISEFEVDYYTDFECNLSRPRYALENILRKIGIQNDVKFDDKISELEQKIDKLEDEIKSNNELLTSAKDIINYNTYQPQSPDEIQNILKKEPSLLKEFRECFRIFLIPSTRLHDIKEYYTGDYLIPENDPEREDYNKKYADILNNFLSGKKAEFNGNSGVHFFDSKSGQRLFRVTLSSGEQQLIELFEILLYKTKKGSLVMIDEPEISLHIEWQRKFIECVREVAELLDFDVIISTHSPGIIHDNYDFMIRISDQS